MELFSRQAFCPTHTEQLSLRFRSPFRSRVGRLTRKGRGEGRGGKQTRFSTAVSTKVREPRSRRADTEPRISSYLFISHTVCLEARLNRLLEVRRGEPCLKNWLHFIRR